MTNINDKTGIAFGIISANCLDSDLVDSLMFSYGTNHSEIEALQEAKHQFLMERLSPEDFDELSPEDYDKKIEEFSDEFIYGSFEESFFLNSGDIDEPLISGEYEGVIYQTSWLGGALNFVIFESPVITDKANRGSPCVPNMGVLDELDGDYQCYSIPEEWRDNREY